MLSGPRVSPVLTGEGRDAFLLNSPEQISNLLKQRI
ncbi:protein of unknown function [Streptomyces sp. KY75]|nr:protein of unknown function [Streptomyces sp. KY75]